VSRRPLKRHVQQALPFKQRGGKRKGAGRPKNGFRASERHTKRPALSPRSPTHVILRVEKEVGSLRRRDAYHAFRRALKTAYQRKYFRVVHVSLQREHIHLVIEAANERALARGMQGLQIAAARYLNAAISRERRRRRTGRVFVDRYHVRILRTPRETRNVINYVLNNWRHHSEDRGLDTMFWEVDWFSSGPTFAGWREARPELPAGYQPLATSSPETWLLAVGWKQGGAISMHAIPARDCYEG